MNELNVDDYVTHNFHGVGETQLAVDALHAGKCIRSVVRINPAPLVESKSMIRVESSVKVFDGSLKTVSHWSEANQCQMKF